MRILRTNNPKDRAKLAKTLARSGMSDAAREVVARVIADVRKRGDKAVLEYTRKFDGVKLAAGGMRVSRGEFERAAAEVPPRFMATAKRIRKAVAEYHRMQLPKEWGLDAGDGAEVGEIVRPVESVGVYIPGGTAPLVSTLLMTVVPASIAGVKRIMVTTPPNREGKVNSYMLATAELLGVTEVYKIGGAQAIAAMACGTRTVPKADKIVGPGNMYVTEAKRQLFGTVDIDCIAGPSEIAVLADRTANPRYVAADILSQAEHGTGEEVSILVTDSEELAEQVREEIAQQLRLASRREIMSKALRNGTFAVVTKDMDEAIEVTNKFAPEHLEIMTKKPQAILRRINNAGAVFIGSYTPVPVGDFVAGPSHVLPTNGAARAFSGLSVLDFIKRIGTVRYTRRKLRSVAKDLAMMAEVEGLDAHGRTVEVREP